MALGVLISLGLAKVVAVVTLASMAKRKKQSRTTSQKTKKQFHKQTNKKLKGDAQ